MSESRNAVLRLTGPYASSGRPPGLPVARNQSRKSLVNMANAAIVPERMPIVSATTPVPVVTPAIRKSYHHGLQNIRPRRRRRTPCRRQ